MEQTEIRKVRASIHQQCGNRVKIQQDLGRNKVDIQEGVIQQAYPSVFTVLIDDDFVGGEDARQPGRAFREYSLR